MSLEGATLAVQGSMPKINLYNLGAAIYSAFQKKPKPRTEEGERKTLIRKDCSTSTTTGVDKENFDFYIKGHKEKKKEGKNYFVGYEGLAKACLALYPDEVRSNDDIKEMASEMAPLLVTLVQTEYDASNPSSDNIGCERTRTFSSNPSPSHTSRSVTSSVLSNESISGPPGASIVDTSSVPSLTGAPIHVSDDTTLDLFKLGDEIYSKFKVMPKEKGKTLKVKRMKSGLGPTNYIFFIEGSKGRRKEGVNEFIGYEGLAKACLALCPPEVDIDYMVEQLIKHVKTQHDVLNPNVSNSARGSVANAVHAPTSNAGLADASSPSVSAAASVVTPVSTNGATGVGTSARISSFASVATGTARSGKRLSQGKAKSSKESSSKRARRSKDSMSFSIRQSARETKNIPPRAFYSEKAIGRGEVEVEIDESQGRNQHSISLEKISRSKEYGQGVYTDLSKCGYTYKPFTDDDGSSDWVFLPRGFNKTTGVKNITRYDKYEGLGEAYNGEEKNFRRMVVVPQLALDALAMKGLVDEKGNAKQCDDLISICEDAKAKVDEISKAELDGIFTFCWLATKYKWRRVFDDKDRPIILAPEIEHASGIAGVTAYFGYVALNDAMELDGDDGNNIVQRWLRANRTEESADVEPTEASGGPSTIANGISEASTTSHPSRGEIDLIHFPSTATNHRPNRVSMSPSNISNDISPARSATSETAADVGSPNQHLTNFIASIEQRAKRQCLAEIGHLKEQHKNELQRLSKEHRDKEDDLKKKLEAEKDTVRKLKAELERKERKARRIRELLLLDDGSTLPDTSTGAESGETREGGDDPVFDGYSGGRTLRSEVTSPQINLKQENPVAGEIFCPHPNCKKPLILSERGCNVTTCTNKDAHAGSFFYFCCHCKRQCNDEQADCDCSKRTNRDARLHEQEKRNKRAALNPILVD